MLIDRERDGHRVYYRYHHRNASIKKQPINQEEVDLFRRREDGNETSRRCSSIRMDR